MKNLLIVVDYQKEFCRRFPRLSGAEGLDQKIAEKIRAYRARGDDVVFTMDTHPTITTRNWRKKPAGPALHRGKPGLGPLRRNGQGVCAGGPRIQETDVSLAGACHWLAGKPYGRIELVGLVSHICVLSNAVMAKALCRRQRLPWTPPARPPMTPCSMKKRWIFWRASR
jgi:nicotinamidase-related amidase